MKVEQLDGRQDDIESELNGGDEVILDESS